nr:reverse transcriptase domain-containing protein [Tanacetum cinerariifolium]
MSTNEQTPVSQPTSAVRNTLRREQAPQNLVRPVPDEDLRECCDKNYHQILQIIAEKLHQEKKKEPQGKVGTQGCLNQVHKPGTEARLFQITKGEGSGKKDGVQKIGERKHKLLPRNIVTKESILEERKQSQKAKEVQEGTGSQNQRSKSQAWRMTYPNHGVWFDDLPKESIDIYDDLKKAFLENYLQQKKCVKDPVEIHNIKQRNGESTKEFVRRYKLECRDVKGARECMKISGFMHGITNPKLFKRLHDIIPKSMEEMMSVTASFLRGEMAASNRERKKSFTLLTKTPREIIALDKGKFKPPSPMTTPVEKRNASKFCEFHREVGHTNDERMHLKRQMEEMLKARKLSYLIKELKQNNGKNQAKTVKKGETSGKDKPLAILMVQPWQKIARQRITQTFSSKLVISFPTLGEEDGTEGPMIIEAEMGRHCVHRIYVDEDASSKILYEHCFRKFRPEIKTQLILVNTPLVGFSGEIIWHLGQISLLVRIGDEEHSMSAQMNFMVVRSPSPYNGIIGRPGVRKIRAIPSTAHGMIKFPLAGGIVTLQSSRIIPLECSMVSEPKVLKPSINQVKEEKIQELCGLLRRHLDVFAWKPVDMTGVPRHIAEHRLNVHEGCLPVRKKKRGQAHERNKAISEEVKLLVEAGIIKEVHYHSWLSNPVMVKKHDDSWRMCVDFKDLNKACPKDEEDEEKTAFITGQGIFCYSKMPFGLKNNGGTYQRLVDKAFQKQIGQNLEVYVDDLVIKSRTKKEVIRDAEETFKTLRKINMKLNPKKCAFGMRKCTFLGYKVDADRLRVSPDKVKAVIDLPSPKTSVKGQILAAFIVERPEDGTPDTPMEDMEELPDPWVLFTDGSSCVNGSGTGLIIMNPEGMKFTYALRFRFNATNNEAEYEALIAGIRIASQM